jgi:hypothetical protein
MPCSRQVTKQALDDTDVPGAKLSPAKEPGLSTHGDDTQGSLEMIGIDRYIGIGEEYFETEAPFAYIVECFDERTARREPLSLELPIDPLEKYFDKWFAVGQSI